MGKIDKEETIRRIRAKANSGQWSNAVIFGMEKAVAIIEVMPVISHGEWILCSERLPKEHGYYIVQTDGSHNAVIDIAEYGRLWSKSCEDFGWGWNKASRVLAWMPLPEPYKEEGDEK